MLEYIWLIPLLPALGALIQLLVGRKLSNKAVSAVSVGLPGVSFLWALGCFFEFLKLPARCPRLQQSYLLMAAGRSFPAG